MLDSSPASDATSPRRPSFLAQLGPGLVTGAADDDPSGIATYSQVGAQFGFGMGWTMLFSFPLMAAIQEVAARIGSVTGRGLAANLRHHYPRWLLRSVLLLLIVANVINLAADIAAMGSALQLLLGGPEGLYAVAFGVGSLLLEIFVSYRRYAGILKWLTLALLAYVAAVFAVDIPWDEALRGALVPSLTLDGTHMAALVAVLGTTISPYLFFWQSSQEVEDRIRRGMKPLCVVPRSAGPELHRIRVDTLVGMGFSILIALFIIMTTAATLHAHGVTDIATTRDAAEALRPIAGPFAFVVFAAGVIGTGLLAVPVLAGSIGYAMGDALRWPIGLGRRWNEARAFYGAIAAATIAAMALGLMPISPVKALFWSAVVNGVLAAPLMAVMMVMASSPRVMGHLTLPPALRVVGWAATAIMAVAAILALVT
jgi:NRAMP (natural resistance-associated macrophage protein)-like metal ion transporter